MDPLVVGGLLSGGSVIANMFGANSRKKARKKALNAEAGRQGELDEEISDLNTGSQDRYQGFNEGVAAKSGSIADYFRGLIEQGRAVPGMIPATRSAPTAAAVEASRAKADAASGARTGSLADVLSFGSHMGDIARPQARDAATIGQLGNFKLGSARVLDSELAAANSKGGGARFLADLLNLGGQIGINRGLAGSFV